MADGRVISGSKVLVTIWTSTGNFWATELDIDEAGRLVSKWQGLHNSDLILTIYGTDKIVTFIHYRDIESISYPVEETNTSTNTTAQYVKAKTLAETGEKLILGDDGVIYTVDPDQVSLRPGITPSYTTTTHGHYDIHR